MQQMFMSTPPSFDQILERLGAAEAQLNAGGRK